MEGDYYLLYIDLVILFLSLTGMWYKIPFDGGFRRGSCAVADSSSGSQIL